jgi:exodeoxyribonuclease-5
MTIQLSPIQNKAVSSVLNWFKLPEKDRPQVFHLFGYAGTGKTTLAKYIVEALSNELKDFSYGFATYTGKASLVLKSKGCEPASTIHRLIYKPIIEQGRIVGFTRHPDSPLEKYDLLIVDEVSMVGEEIGRDLLSFKKPILVLGDPGQLPPIEGQGFFNSPTPEIMLEEIHRQAKDNPIIRLATEVRLGNYLQKGHFGDSRVMSSKFFTGSPLDFDQCLVGMNRTRVSWNRRIRDLKNIGETYPQVGEKLICLKNNYNTNYINGQLCRVKKCEPWNKYLKLKLEDFDTAEQLRSTETHKGFFDRSEIGKNEWYIKDHSGQRRRIDQFTFGYAITCHKAQGSQWDSVLINNESYVFKEHQKNWLYTAITRAADKVTILT